LAAHAAVAALAADGPAAEAEEALAAWAAAAATAAEVDAGDKHRAQNAKSKHKKGQLVFSLFRDQQADLFTGALQPLLLSRLFSGGMW
jgi:hypothetical protein